MEKQNFKPMKVYSDPVHEQQTRTDIENAQAALTKVVEIWNDLNIGPVTDLVKLINDPEAAYSEAVNRNIEVPVQPGKFQLSRELYIKSLSIPVPNQLYIACRDCKKIPLTRRPGLWEVSEGKVVPVEFEAEMLIDAKSVFARTEEHQKLVEDVIRFVDSLNAIGEKTELLMGRPCEYQFFRDKPFRVIQESYPGPFKVEMDPSLMREILR
jgi:hypothetical protein